MEAAGQDFNPLPMTIQVISLSIVRTMIAHPAVLPTYLPDKQSVKLENVLGTGPARIFNRKLGEIRFNLPELLLWIIPIPGNSRRLKCHSPVNIKYI